MSLLPQARLGPYEIIAPIGAGGMGEVFRARDRKLDQWSLARSELTYFDPKENRVMVAPYTVTGGSFEPGKARPWSSTAILRPAIGAPYALHPDGERMVVRGPANEAADSRNLSAVLWLDGFGALRRLSEEGTRR